VGRDWGFVRGAARGGTVVVGGAKTLGGANDTCALVGRRARLTRNRAKGRLYFYFLGRRKRSFGKSAGPSGLRFSRFGPFPGLATGVASRI
jgi:hypothetical protein